jgi:hypothetical protein
VLIRAGAEVNQKSMQGETPLDVAERYHHLMLAVVLRAAGGHPGKGL